MNRLTSVTLPNGGGVVTFKYDPFGRRIQRSGPTGTTNYVYDGANGVEELNAAGAVTARYVQGAGIDEPLAQSGTALTFYNADGLGSITSLTDATGATAATFVYGAFGVLSSSSGTIPSSYRYTAREFDQDTGLYYYRARYYETGLGRLLSEDPIKFEGGINFYAYVFNDPISLFDPSGLKCKKPKLAALWSHYPLASDHPTELNSPTGHTSIWDFIGGKVGVNGHIPPDKGGFANSCVIRMSYALNHSGCDIPFVKDKTSSGADGKWYFRTVADLTNFIQSEWGAPHSLTPQNVGSLTGQTGIIVYQVPGWQDATGHFDLWNGTNTIDGHDYSGKAKGILLWPLD